MSERHYTHTSGLTQKQQNIRNQTRCSLTCTRQHRKWQGFSSNLIYFCSAAKRRPICFWSGSDCKHFSQSVNSLLSQCHPQTSCSNYTNWRGQHHFTLTTTVHYWKSAFITERNPTLDVDDIILVISHRFRIILFVKLCCKHWVARLPTKVAPCGVTNPRLENTVMILYDDPVE